jgi:hypothetical protein
MVMTLDETLKTLRANGVASAELDASGALLKVVFEPKMPDFPTEPQEELDDPWIVAAKALAKQKPAGAGDES